MRKINNILIILMLVLSSFIVVSTIYKHDISVKAVVNPYKVVNYSCLGSGYLATTGLVFATIRNQATATTLYADIYSVQTSKVLTTFYIDRTYLWFNTDLTNTEYTGINSIKLGLYKLAVNDGQSLSVEFYSNTATFPIDTGDYDYRKFSSDLASKTLATFNTNAYTWITLPNTGNWLSYTGYSCLGLWHTRDEGNTAPTGTNWITFSAVSGRTPCLLVNYSIVPTTTPLESASNLWDCISLPVNKTVSKYNVWFKSAITHVLVSWNQSILDGTVVGNLYSFNLASQKYVNTSNFIPYDGFMILYLKPSWDIYINTTTPITFYDNLINCSGTHEYLYSDLLGYRIYNNYTGYSLLLNILEDLKNCTGTHSSYYNSATGWQIYNNYTGFSLLLTTIEHLINCTGTHSSYYNSATGWKMYLNYTGNVSTGGSVVNRTINITINGHGFFTSWNGSINTNVQNISILMNSDKNITGNFTDNNSYYEDKYFLSGTLQIAPELLFLGICMTLWLFFVAEYIKDRRSDNRVMMTLLCIAFSIPLSLVLMTITGYFLFGYVITLMIPVFSIYLFADAILQK